MAAVVEPALNAQEALPLTQRAAAQVNTASVENKAAAVLRRLKSSLIDLTTAPMVVLMAIVVPLTLAMVIPAMEVTRVAMQESTLRDSLSQLLSTNSLDPQPIEILTSLVALTTSSAKADFLSLEEEAREAMVTATATARRLLMATTKLMAISRLTVKRRAMAMTKAMDVTEATVLLMNTLRRKVMAAKKATETKPDMVPVTTMARRRATVMTRATVKTPSMDTAQARMSTA